MRVLDLKGELPPELYNVLGEEDWEELRPPQEKAIESGVLKGNNMLVSSPTASGKTLVAEMAFVKNLLEKKGKAVYVVPLKALGNEKYEEFKDKYGHLLDVAISTGDMDSEDRYLSSKDLIIVTSEKMDSLMRHRVPWLSEVNTVVIDEVHLLNDAERGPTLEVLMTRFKDLSDFQLISLSATISNSEELADWLNSELVESDYRPVELKQGVYFDGEIDFGESLEEVDGANSRPEQRVLEDTLRKGKQMLLFVSSRRNSEAAAERAADLVSEDVTDGEKEKLKELSDEVKNVLSSPTKQCKRLSRCIKKGAAFHHAGLLKEQREKIEENFKDNLIKVISCTPTLALGVDIPAFRSVIRDLKRYNPEYGMDWIPTLEFKQMVGRAGRPKFEDYGEGIAISKSEGDKEEIFDRYIDGDIEKIYSKLSADPVLRMQLLGLISTREVKDKEKAFNFFSKTFYAHQYEDIKSLTDKIDRILLQLENFGFINIEDEELYTTELGKRVSELYLDPLSAHRILELFGEAKMNPMYFLHMICSTNEIRALRVKKSDFDEVQSKLAKYSDKLPPEPSPWDAEYDDYLRAFKTSLMFKSWINEVSEDDIMDKYGERPGVLKSHLYMADWLLYSAVELAGIKDRSGIKSYLKKLRVRMKHGIKEELLDLTKLKQIGRVRSRKLFRKGIKGPADLKETDYEDLSNILGPKIAKKVKDQLE